jgi:hypothetical protein
MLRLGRSGEYRIQPDFPAWGVLPWFDVARFRTFAEPNRAQRRNFRNRQPVRARIARRRAAN